MTLITTGSMLGAIFGLAHSLYVFRVVLHYSDSDAPGIAVYSAIWTFALWLLLGSYLLLFWLVACLLYLINSVWHR